MTMETVKESAKRIIPSFFLKPLPSSAEDCIEELRSFGNLDRDADPPPRAALYHCLLSSVKKKRPFNSAMILLVGSSGVGKSSTINNLLDTGGGIPVAVTSSTESETKTTKEYILTTDYPDYEVCDLKMGIIDTPGFNDTVGMEQDACNFVSIKRFFETHPGLPEQFTYPNLVFLVVRINDTRIKGQNSNLSKSLRGIKLLKVVDASHPNLVVIGTFCCSVAPKNWRNKIQQKKDAISTAVFEVLGVSAPVVLIENDFDEYDLEKDGDFTLLPNGERQPKNLYNACRTLLERNEDRFGLLVFNSCFTGAKKDKPTKGHEVEAKDSTSEVLCDDEKEFLNAFSDAAKGSNLIAKRVMEYVEEKDLDKTQQEHVSKLGEWMNSMGLSNEGRLQSVTMEAINCFYDGEISDHGTKMLEQKFGIKNESSSCISAEMVGRGYNILLDKTVSSDILKFSSVNETKYGFNIPACAQIIKVNATQEFQMNFQSDKLYVENRLENLGVSVDFVQSMLTMAPKFRASASQKENGSSKSTKTQKISLKEYRIVQINIGNFESEEISLTDNFRSAVNGLPDQYTADEKCKENFKRFFNRFGHYVINSAYVGGAVEEKTCTEGLKASKQSDNSIDGSVGANVSGVIGAEIGPNYQLSTESGKTILLEKTETRWYGGRSDLHRNSTLHSEEKFLEWKLSLSKEPVMLTTEMNLEDISCVVAIVDKNKADVCHQALLDLFDNKDLQPVGDKKYRCQLEERNTEPDVNLEEERREASNTREGSAKNPDNKGWWETITKNVYPVSGTVVVGALVLSLIKCLKE